MSSFVVVVVVVVFCFFFVLFVCFCLFGVCLFFSLKILRSKIVRMTSSFRSTPGELNTRSMSEYLQRDMVVVKLLMTVTLTETVPL